MTDRLMQARGGRRPGHPEWTRCLPFACGGFILAVAGACGAPVTVEKGTDVVAVNIDGRLFSEYRFNDPVRPFFYPVMAPTGVNMTRDWPMKDGNTDESHDHPHHRGLWFTHGSVGGYSFWAGKGCRIVHQAFTQLSSGEEVGVLGCRNAWVDPEGRTVCTDERTHRFRAVRHGVLMDMEIVIHAPLHGVRFGDTKEGSLAIRLAPSLRVTGKVGRGHVLNSEGVTDGEAWGKRARWCDYSGPLEGQVVGVAIFDHPGNLRHPTWWHVRTYGLFAANPFAASLFGGQPKGSGDVDVGAEETLTLRYRFYFHKGDAQAAGVDDLYRDYVAGNKSSL